MAKLLDHITARLREVTGTPPSASTMESARQLLIDRWNASGTLSSADVNAVVKALQPTNSGTTKAVEAAGLGEANAQPLRPSASSTTPSLAQAARGGPTPALSPLSLLQNTSKRQRRILADDEWARAAEEDRVAAAVGRKTDHTKHLEHVGFQKKLLDHQLAERDAEKEAERRRKRQMQDDMTKLIEDNREATRREAQEAHDKAAKEKEFRARQQRELDEAREQQRIEEHNEQVRQALLAEQELQRLRDLDLKRKNEERAEWYRLLQLNQQRMEEKKHTKEKEREEGRMYMKLYADNLDRLDRERAEQKATKEARAAVFRRLAEGVASCHQKKEQDMDSRIEAEFQEQLSKTLADEAFRRDRNKRREVETHRVLEQQMALKKTEEEREREASRKLAEAMREQERIAREQEDLRKQAAKSEAARLNEFLNTQLQLLHCKETKPLETSITRPLSRAKTMFSPTRYRPSPSPQLNH